MISVVSNINIYELHNTNSNIKFPLQLNLISFTKKQNSPLIKKLDFKIEINF